ncbi:unnamed protein product [Gongylonema pulchrum]|uniref:Uncharacterized protein n=1 Tax=Gongylonema pulchrum TaxID=637853 RepID=A0A183EHF5_9BILA|nr:unnamed protein product [Gongylonema pulchrum]
MAETSEVMPIFYKCAFLSCIEDNKRRKRQSEERSGESISAPHTIKTIRDHAHLLVDFIDDIILLMFDNTTERNSMDLSEIGNYQMSQINGGVTSARGMLVTEGEKRRAVPRIFISRSIFCKILIKAIPQSRIIPARTHLRLEPLGFHRTLWIEFGEALAEVMFSQVKSYNKTPSVSDAWKRMSPSYVFKRLAPERI